MKLGEVLMKERERKKLSLEDMAGKLGIPAEQVPGDRGGRLAGRDLGAAARQDRHQAGDPDLPPARRQRQVRRHPGRTGRRADPQASRAPGQDARSRWRSMLGISREEYAADRGRPVAHRGVRAALPALRRGHRAAGLQPLLPVRPAARQAERRRLPVGAGGRSRGPARRGPPSGPACTPFPGTALW